MEFLHHTPQCRALCLTPQQSDCFSGLVYAQISTPWCIITVCAQPPPSCFSLISPCKEPNHTWQRLRMKAARGQTGAAVELKPAGRGVTKMGHAPVLHRLLLWAPPKSRELHHWKITRQLDHIELISACTQSQHCSEAVGARSYTQQFCICAHESACFDEKVSRARYQANEQ